MIIDSLASGILYVILYVAVMTEEDQAVVTRGCTGMADEAQYKCSTHTAGGQVKQF